MGDFRLFRINVEQGSPDDAVMEAARRMNYDGIPRHVYSDGKIMKWDWELSSEDLEDNFDGEALEEHIARLLEQQHGS